jgi:hypothetical protein
MLVLPHPLVAGAPMGWNKRTQGWMPISAGLEYVKT